MKINLENGHTKIIQKLFLESPINYNSIVLYCSITTWVHCMFNGLPVSVQGLLVYKSPATAVVLLLQHSNRCKETSRNALGIFCIECGN